ncbi:hypothetical protein M4D79_05375 [Mycolicibacterium novocastrense]|nr:hypothetical protein M4D79_05375 [Mycolicibacterium novocastrense]
MRSIPTGLDDGIRGDHRGPSASTEETTSPFGVGGPELPPEPANGARMMAWSSSEQASPVEDDAPPASQESPGDQLGQDPVGQQPIQVIANPTPAGSEATSKQPEEVVVEEDIDGTGAEKAGNGALSGKTPAVSLKPALPTLPKLNVPKLPKLRGPISFDPPGRLGPSPVSRPDRNETTNADTVRQPENKPAGNTGGEPDAAGAAA